MFGYNTKPLVPQDELLTLGQNHPFTPDYYELSMQHMALLFVADEMMTGRRDATILKEDVAKVYGTAYTQHNYLMFKKNLGKRTYPVILPKVHNEGPGILSRAVAAPIKGELYKVQSEYMTELDKFKNNGHIFTRERVLLDIPYRQKFDRTFAVHRKDTMNIHNEVVLGEWKHQKDVWAWMYVGNPEHFYWETHGDTSFVPVKVNTPSDRNLKPFYHYTSKEDAI